jgi:hypothetical protein
VSKWRHIGKRFRVGGKEMVPPDSVSNSVEEDAKIFKVLSPKRLSQHINPKHSCNLIGHAREFSKPDDHNTEKIIVKNREKKE